MQYVLCVPCGGLNDMLTQIEVCWKYCRQHNRTLIIDMAYDTHPIQPLINRPSFADHFDNYFTLSGANVIGRVNHSVLRQLNKLTVYPHNLRGKLGDYTVIMKNDGQYHHAQYARLAGHDIPMKLDIERTYEEDCILHHSHGGGTPNEILRHLKVNKYISGTIVTALSSINGPYEAIHIRNTDWCCDYKKFFTSIRDKIQTQNLFVCSDDYEAILYARQFFARHTIIELMPTPDNRNTGTPRHLNPEPLSQFRNVAALIDLFALAYSDKIHVCQLSDKQLAKVSGFTRLALSMQQNRVIKSMLGLS